MAARSVVIFEARGSTGARVVSFPWVLRQAWRARPATGRGQGRALRFPG